MKERRRTYNKKRHTTFMRINKNNYNIDQYYNKDIK